MRDASRVRVATPGSSRRAMIVPMSRDLTGQAGRSGAKDSLLKPLIPIACVLVLEACGTMNAMLDPVSPADVAALEEGVTIADTLALNYTRLPACPIAAPSCSVAATRQSIKGYAQQAHDSVKTLQAASAAGAPAALAAAQVALAALEASIPALPAATPPAVPQGTVPLGAVPLGAVPSGAVPSPAAASPNDTSIGPWGAPFGTPAPY